MDPRFLQALRERDSGVRLLVPTATMAQHLRNDLARQGYVFRPNAIRTLSAFAGDFAQELPLIGRARFFLLVEHVVRALAMPEFARVEEFAGFCSSLARTIEEFADAGCAADRLRARLPEAPLAKPFLAVYEVVERELAARSLGLRAQRMAFAARRIRESGLDGIHSVWVSGFADYRMPELAVLDAMRLHARVESETLRPGAVRAPVTLVEAPLVEREVDEIARRVLVEAAGGRLFREIAVVVRNPEVYEELLRAAFERFDVPARFYFETDLATTGVVRFLSAVMEALLGGWEQAAVLRALNMTASGVGGRSSMDRLDFDIRSGPAGEGLEALRSATQNERIHRVLASFEQMDGWRSGSARPARWAERLRSLSNLVRQPRPGDKPALRDSQRWAAEAAALQAFEAALEETAAALEDRPLTLAEFWRESSSVLRLTTVRSNDARRNVVHVMTAAEARGWELPVMIVCGLVDKQFPKHHTQNPFFADAARRELCAAGITLRSSEDDEREEEAIFRTVAGRATESLVLTYPKYDDRGERNLRSIFLSAFTVPAEVAQPVRPPVAADRPGGLSHTGIRSQDLLHVIGATHASMKATALEDYLQCPFKFFALHTLKLETAPCAPEDRLDYRVQGSVVHDVLAKWIRERPPIEALFEEVFREQCQRNFVPDSYRTALLRHCLLEDLRQFARQPAPPSGFQIETETQFEFAVGEGMSVRGRIDRLDRSPAGEGIVIDYKYSSVNAQERLKEWNRYLQGPLYLLALERFFHLEAAGAFYCSVKGGVKYAGWGDPLGRFSARPEPLDRQWLDWAVETTMRLASEIRAGRTAAAPLVPDPCRYCDFRDVCRYEVAAALTQVAGE